MPPPAQVPMENLSTKEAREKTASAQEILSQWQQVMNVLIASQASRGRRRAGAQKTSFKRIHFFAVRVRRSYSDVTLSSDAWPKPHLPKSHRWTWDGRASPMSGTRRTWSTRQPQRRAWRRSRPYEKRAPHSKTFGMRMRSEAIATAIARSLAPPGEDIVFSSTACASPFLSH